MRDSWDRSIADSPAPVRSGLWRALRPLIVLAHRLSEPPSLIVDPDTGPTLLAETERA
ncbi:hypothetical protein [Streptomyces goshikiensis]|uniref:hypothetical protein n=1 Tax=Streptomyces goshikiensis TaxID=1942 RepID=UPI003647E920